jgi:small conductance mechanosensitive channel
VLLTRAVTWFATRLTTHIDTADERGDAVVRSEAAKHRHSLAQAITWAVVALIYSVTAVLVLIRFGVPIAGLVAPATVAGVALGFGAQRIVQDILAGFFIVAERQYGYGDLIRIGSLGSTAGVTGTVEDVTLRTTRLRTVDGEVVFVPNGQINQVTNLSRDWARAIVDVPLPATAEIDHVNELLQGVGQAVYRDQRLRPLILDAPTVMGVENIDVDATALREAGIVTTPEVQDGRLAVAR